MNYIPKDYLFSAFLFSIAKIDENGGVEWLHQQPQFFPPDATSADVQRQFFADISTALRDRVAGEGAVQRVRCLLDHVPFDMKPHNDDIARVAAELQQNSPSPPDAICQHSAPDLANVVMTIINRLHHGTQDFKRATYTSALSLFGGHFRSMLHFFLATFNPD